MFELKISTANEAFDQPATEVCRILRKIAKQLENGELEAAVRDINGNTVGRYRLNNSEPR